VTNAEKYVAAAYLAVFAVVLAYVLIMSVKVARLQRELADLAVLAHRRREETELHHGREATEVG
jgi:CcmD family protein